MQTDFWSLGVGIPGLLRLKVASMRMNDQSPSGFKTQSNETGPKPPEEGGITRRSGLSRIVLKNTRGCPGGGQWTLQPPCGQRNGEGGATHRRIISGAHSFDKGGDLKLGKEGHSGIPDPAPQGCNRPGKWRQALLAAIAKRPNAGSCDHWRMIRYHRASITSVYLREKQNQSFRLVECTGLYGC